MIGPPTGRAALASARVASGGERSKTAENGGGSGALVCVVDDDESVRDSYRILLESLGFAVTTYASGRDVLADERRHQASYFIVDQHMPEMDGLATLGALRGERPDAQTILITGRLDDEITARAMALDVGAILEKPFAALRLLELLIVPREPIR
jgi:two-component system, LuxR family, response regulator FixJ